MPLTTGDRHRLLWQAQLRKGQTYVYFIQGDPGTPIKVGFTNRVGKRLGELQTGSYQRLHVLAVLPAPRSAETAYHRLLQSERGIGEWFSGPLTDQLMFRVLEIADRMVASYDGSGRTPDIYEFDDLIERPVIEPEPEIVIEKKPTIEVIPAGPTIPMVDPSVKSRIRSKPEKPVPLPPDGDKPWRGKLPDWYGDRVKPRHWVDRPPPGQTRFT